ncbi:hypothetical protein N7495_006824 [Penicillium taxi]|uniref:uncharacterized protein n=1 Tax=Penicillium taxi TaxID=168475 RepID=UPI002544FCD9|nr:uncharacterized protein N7495_006824 [Penicillium taxi]KAJ5895133.1 hypothetical protein N7495_006824 [Penicillium taxi]
MARPAVLPASPVKPGSRAATRSSATRTTTSAAAKAQAPAKATVTKAPAKAKITKPAPKPKTTKAPAKPKVTKAAANPKDAKPTKPITKAPAKPRVTKTKASLVESTPCLEDSDDELDTLMKEEPRVTPAPRVRPASTKVVKSAVSEPKKRPGRPKVNTAASSAQPKPAPNPRVKTPTTRQIIKSAIQSAVPDIINATNNAFHGRSNILRGPAKKKTVRFAESLPSEGDPSEGESDIEMPDVIDALSAGLDASPIRKVTPKTPVEKLFAESKDIRPFSPQTAARIAKCLSVYAPISSDEDELSMKISVPAITSPLPQVNGPNNTLNTPVKRVNFSPNKISSLVDENGKEKVSTPTLSTIMSSPARRPEISPSPSPFKYSIGRGVVSREGANSAPVPELNLAAASPLKMSPRKGHLGAISMKSSESLASPTSSRSSLFASPAKKFSNFFRNSSMFSPKDTPESSTQTPLEATKDVEPAISSEYNFDSLFDTASQADATPVKANKEVEPATSPEYSLNSLFDTQADATPVKANKAIEPATSPEYSVNNVFDTQADATPVKVTKEVEPVISPEYSLNNLFDTQADATPVKATKEIEPVTSPEYSLNNLFDTQADATPVKVTKEVEPVISPEYSLNNLFDTQADATTVKATKEIEPATSPEYSLNSLFDTQADATPVKVTKEVEPAISPEYSLKNLFDSPAKVDHKSLHTTKEVEMEITMEPSSAFHSLSDSPLSDEPTPLNATKEVEMEITMEPSSAFHSLLDSPLDNEQTDIFNSPSHSLPARSKPEHSMDKDRKIRRKSEGSKLSNHSPQNERIGSSPDPVQDSSPCQRRYKRPSSEMSPDFNAITNPKRRCSESTQTRPDRSTVESNIRRKSEGSKPLIPSSDSMQNSSPYQSSELPTDLDVTPNLQCKRNIKEAPLSEPPLKRPERPNQKRRTSDGSKPMSLLPQNEQFISFSEPEQDSSPSERRLKRSSSELSPEDQATPSAKRSRQAEDDLPATDKTSRLVSSQSKAKAKYPALSVGPLSGAIVYVDVHLSSGEDVSCSFTEALENLGATVRKSWRWNPGHIIYSTGDMPPPKVGITHLVYKDGGIRTLEKVKQAGGLVKCVKSSWVIDCEKTGKWLDEAEYAVDTSILPRGGARRKKSMVPQKITNVNGTLFYSDGKSTPRPKRRSSQAQVAITPRVPDYNFADLDTLGLTPGPGTPGNRLLVQQSCPPKQSCQGLFPDGPLDFRGLDDANEWGAEEANASATYYPF